MLVLSPHIKRCFPRIQTSPSFVTGSAGGSITSPSASSSYSGAISSISSPSISSNENPVSSKSKSSSFNASNSMRKISSSHPAFKASLLSAMIYAFFCASVKWLASIHGNSSIPSFFAAITRPCPAIMPLSPSMIIGFKKPNSLMLEAICSTCSSLWVRLLFA